MSVQKNLEAHQVEITEEIQHVQQLISQSKSGRQVQEVASRMVQSGYMKRLLDFIGDSENEKERILLLQYLEKMLQHDPANGMQIFSRYLKDTAEDAQYRHRAGYYLAASEAALQFGRTREYQEYVLANNIFQNDMDEKAVAAREATKAMQAKMKKWSGI